MSRLLKRITIGTAIGGAAVLALGVACYAAGARINTTKSIPIGLYWTSSVPVEKGAYVLFCPPQVGVFESAKGRGYIGAGFCPGGYGYMMKRVLAAKDDVVTIADEGVRVNGALLPLSAPIKADKAGRPLPRYQANSFTLGNSEVLLMSNVSATSFDGRYFGPVNRSQIQTVISPVITW
ncbi:MAG: conjugative transfer signal peptidase TraF [Burkholderia sp.]